MSEIRQAILTQIAQEPHPDQDLIDTYGHLGNEFIRFMSFRAARVKIEVDHPSAGPFIEWRTMPHIPAAILAEAQRIHERDRATPEVTYSALAILAGVPSPVPVIGETPENAASYLAEILGTPTADEHHPLQLGVAALAAAAEEIRDNMFYAQYDEAQAAARNVLTAIVDYAYPETVQGHQEVG